jgi:hypothetical protein
MSQHFWKMHGALAYEDSNITYKDLSITVVHT